MNKTNSLEGLRGIAALVVVFMHLSYTFLVDIHDKVESWASDGVFYKQIIGHILRAVLDGNFAVWLFWVMSGVVLSIKFFDLENKSNLGQALAYLRNSAKKRYFRLAIPVLASVMITYLFFSLNLISNTELAHAFGSIYVKGPISWLNSQWAFIPSFDTAFNSGVWYSFFDYHKVKTYNSVLWTMGPELFGSFILFFFLAFSAGSNKRWLLYVIVISFFVYYNKLYYVAFISGIAISDLKRFIQFKIDNSVIKILLFALLIYLVSLKNYNGYFHLILATVTVIFVYVFGFYERFLSNKYILFLGRISFSLYLVHMVVIGVVSAPVYFSLLPYFGNTVSKLASAMMVLVVSLLFATVFYRFIEKDSPLYAKKIVSIIESLIMLLKPFLFKRNTIIKPGL